MLKDLQVTRVSPRPIAAVRRQAPLAQLPKVIPQACGEVWQFLKASGVPNTGLNLVVYQDRVMNFECGVIVNQPFTSTDSVFCSATPGGLAASVAYFGPYQGLGEAHEAISALCKTQGLSPAGPFWEVYDHWNDDPSQLRTDIFYLLEEGASSPS